MPLELMEGRVARLHISGDWTLSQGLRPRLAMAGVLVRARLRPPPNSPPTSSAFTSSGTSIRAFALRALPTATTIKQLLKRIRIDIEDVDIAVQEGLDAAEAEASSPRAALQQVPCVVRAATFGFVVHLVTTEAALSEATQATAKGSPADGAGCLRGILMQFGGFYWVPQVVARAQQCRPKVAFDTEDTRQWLVVFPAAVQVCPFADAEKRTPAASHCHRACLSRCLPSVWRV
jgi:hypothetical protein